MPHLKYAAQMCEESYRAKGALNFDDLAPAMTASSPSEMRSALAVDMIDHAVPFERAQELARLAGDAREAMEAGLWAARNAANALVTLTQSMEYAVNQAMTAAIRAGGR